MLSFYIPSVIVLSVMAPLQVQVSLNTTRHYATTQILRCRLFILLTLYMYHAIQHNICILDLISTLSIDNTLHYGMLSTFKTGIIVLSAVPPFQVQVNLNTIRH